MGFAKALVLLSLLIVVIAVLVTRDEFAQQRQHLLNLIPECVKTQLGIATDDTSSVKIPQETELGGTDEPVGSENLFTVAPAGKLLTKQELKAYDGSAESPGLYLGILGQVFDVSKGARHYGPGGGYSFFAATDGTRAFVTGEFNEKGLIEDVSDIKPQQALELKEWLEFYHKDYTYIGKVIGHFYDENGDLRPPIYALSDKVKVALKVKAADQEDARKFPQCNSRWSKEDGTTLWCSDKSGGIERGWAGVPRIYHRPGTKSSRCACIRTTGPPTDEPSSTSNRGDLDNPNFRPYAYCDPMSDTCKIVKK